MFTLRDYQELAIEQVRQAIRAGYRRILIVAPTGSGKTVIAAQIVKLAAEKFRRSMFLAHRRELIYQCADKLEKFGVDHGILMAGEYPYGAADCQVASIQTIAARCITTDRLPLPNSDVVIVDEAHRSLAPTYLTLINHYGEEVVIGLTATPIRGDGKGLGHVYDYLVQCPTIQELIDLGHLVQPHTFAPTIPDLTGVRTRGGDYDEGDLDRAMNRRSLVGDVVEHWYRLASDRPTIVFASSVKHSINLSDEFRKMGAKAAHIDGDTPLDERKQIIADLQVGNVQVVCNYAVLTEGFDEPSLSACVLARPTKNLGLYLQMGGRTLRPSEATNKKDSLIIDHSGNVYEHGFIQDEHHWVLEEGRALNRTNEDRKKELDEKKPITCVMCATVYTGQLPCPHCGHVPVKKGKYVESRSGDLMEVRMEKRRTAKKREFTMDEKRQWFRELCGHAMNKKKGQGWVAHTYKAKFGVWPNSFSPDRDGPIEPSGEVRGFIRHRNIAYAKKMEKNNENDNQASSAR
jgi:superfamily II DNA or RNA helicase